MMNGILTKGFSGGPVEGDASRVDPEQLRIAMRRWTTGVTIVTSIHEGVRHGMTVSSFTSISLYPPLVLVSLEYGTRTHDLVKKSGIFGVSILDSRSREISERFAGKETEMEDRFRGLDVYTLASGAPLLKAGLAGFDCRVVSTHSPGGNSIFIADVTAVMVGPNTGDPLIYYERDYWRLEGKEHG
jgi:flavin reductase (DIM6/NTAB) family NADH-FMN oxidoreductase RutF